MRRIDEAGELNKSELLGEFKKQFEEEDRIRLICETNIFYKHIDIRSSGINQSPIFIVGFPRSGTTLLQSLVATQNIYTFPETHYFNLVLNSINTSGENVKDEYDVVINAIEERYPLSDEAKDYIWICLKRKSLSVKKLFEIQVMDGLIKQGVDEGNLSSVRWLEKTPSHAFKLQQIKLYYPQAKFIYILRNPLDAFSSWRRVSIGWGQPALPVEEYASLWIKLLKSAERFKKKYPSDLKFIRLEELIDNVNAVVEELMLFVNGEFNANALDDRGKAGDHFILPNEKWKISGAVGVISKDVSDDANDKLTLTEKIKSEFMLNKYMNKYGYEIKYWRGEKLEWKNHCLSVYDWINTHLSGLKSRCYIILKRILNRVVRLYTYFKNTLD